MHVGLLANDEFRILIFLLVTVVLHDVGTYGVHHGVGHLCGWRDAGRPTCVWGASVLLPCQSRAEQKRALTGSAGLAVTALRAV